MEQNPQLTMINRFRKRAGGRTLHRLCSLGALLAMVALACNAPVAGQATIMPPPTPGTPGPEHPTVPESLPALVEPATAPALLPAETSAVVTTEPAGVSTPALLPTFTPIAGPTLAATSTPRATIVGPVAPATTLATATPLVQGPLRFTYDFNWRFAPDNPFLVIGRVAFHAQGGNGVYTYYHDDIRQPGATFEFNWVACRPKPGSLRVDSGDGQSVRHDYYQETPCPTPTPAP
jgi:hypothetical protein